MATRWHYRIHGRDVGPVDFATLQLMATEERLFVDDEIREEHSDQWVLADTVSGLFPQSLGEDDLSSMLSDAGAPAVHVDRANWRDACYCRTRTDELGPMTYDALVALARSGRLARRDQVRLGTHGSWVEARSVESLFENPNRATQEATSMLDSFEIVADPTPSKPRPPRQAPEPVLQMEDDDVAVVAVPDVDALWSCRVLGQEIGPITWTDLRELVENRQLGPNDRVRKGNAIGWVPAGTINDLFPKRKKKRRTRKNISDDDVLDILQPEEPEEEFSSHLAPQRSFERAKRPSPSGSPVQQPKSADSPRPPEGAPPRPARPDLAAAIAAASLPRPGFTPPPPSKRPAPPREKRKMGNPLAGLGGGFSLDPLTNLFGSAWKPVVGVAAALLVVVAVIYGGASLLISKGTKPFYQPTARVWNEAKTLRKAESANGWKTFGNKYRGRITELAQEIEQESSSDDQLGQSLLACYRDCLPKMIEAPVDGADEAWDEMEKHMQQAKTIYMGETSQPGQY